MIDENFFSSLSMDAPEDWLDITDDLPAGAPPTLGRADGSGVLQFSLARYKGGDQPKFGSGDLVRMLREFAKSNRLGVAAAEFSRKTKTGMLCAFGEFVVSDDLTAVWYVSNSQDILLVTYCSKDQDARKSGEISQAKEIVESILL